MGHWFQEFNRMSEAAFLSYGPYMAAILNFSSVIYLNKEKFALIRGININKLFKIIFYGFFVVFFLKLIFNWIILRNITLKPIYLVI